MKCVLIVLFLFTWHFGFSQSNVKLSQFHFYIDDIDRSNSFYEGATILFFDNEFRALKNDLLLDSVSIIDMYLTFQDQTFLFKGISATWFQDVVRIEVNFLNLSNLKRIPKKDAKKKFKDLDGLSNLDPYSNCYYSPYKKSHWFISKKTMRSKKAIVNVTFHTENKEKVLGYILFINSPIIFSQYYKLENPK